MRLIDFDNIQNNDFKVVNQFTITNNGQNKRPDVILFVNGLPLVVIEFKNPADENATINSAFRQKLAQFQVAFLVLCLGKVLMAKILQAILIQD